MESYTTPIDGDHLIIGEDGKPKQTTNVVDEYAVFKATLEAAQTANFAW